jgi:hypothetical protein
LINPTVNPKALWKPLLKVGPIILTAPQHHPRPRDRFLFCDLRRKRSGSFFLSRDFCRKRSENCVQVLKTSWHTIFNLNSKDEIGQLHRFSHKKLLKLVDILDEIGIQCRPRQRCAIKAHHQTQWW